MVMGQVYWAVHLREQDLQKTIFSVNPVSDMWGGFDKFSALPKIAASDIVIEINARGFVK